MLKACHLGLGMRLRPGDGIAAVAEPHKVDLFPAFVENVVFIKGCSLFWPFSYSTSRIGVQLKLQSSPCCE